MLKQVGFDNMDIACISESKLSIHVQGVSGGIVNILGGGSMDCSE
jgi:hypothetical protein